MSIEKLIKRVGKLKMTAIGTGLRRARLATLRVASFLITGNKSAYVAVAITMAAVCVVIAATAIALGQLQQMDLFLDLAVAHVQVALLAQAAVGGLLFCVPMWLIVKGVNSAPQAFAMASKKIEIQEQHLLGEIRSRQEAGIFEASLGRAPSKKGASKRL